MLGLNTAGAGGHPARHLRSAALVEGQKAFAAQDLERGRREVLKASAAVRTAAVRGCAGGAGGLSRLRDGAANGPSAARLDHHLERAFHQRESHGC